MTASLELQGKAARDRGLRGGLHGARLSVAAASLRRGASVDCMVLLVTTRPNYGWAAVVVRLSARGVPLGEALPAAGRTGSSGAARPTR